MTAERALLHHLRGGCMAPVGALGRFRDGTIAVASSGAERGWDAAANCQWHDSSWIKRMLLGAAGGAVAD